QAPPAKQTEPAGPEWKPGGPAGGPAPADRRLGSPYSLERLTETQPNEPYPMPPEPIRLDVTKQPKEAAECRRSGCVKRPEGVRDMHFKQTLHIGCTDCHGGDAQKDCPDPGSTRYCPAAPPTKNPSSWRSSANPVRSYTLLNHESPDYIRF